MNIGLLNTQITFQTQTITEDSVGNHIKAWADIYVCHATVSGESNAESEGNGAVTHHYSIDFTVRFCNAVKNLDAGNCRIKMGSDYFNVTGVDHFNNRRQMVKFHCEKADK